MMEEYLYGSFATAFGITGRDVTKRSIDFGVNWLCRLYTHFRILSHYHILSYCRSCATVVLSLLVILSLTVVSSLTFTPSTAWPWRWKTQHSHTSQRICSWDCCGTDNRPSLLLCPTNSLTSWLRYFNYPEHAIWCSERRSSDLLSLREISTSWLPSFSRLLRGLYIITRRHGKQYSKLVLRIWISVPHVIIYGAFLYECDGTSLRIKLPEPAVLKRLICPKSIFLWFKTCSIS